MVSRAAGAGASFVFGYLGGGVLLAINLLMLEKPGLFGFEEGELTVHSTPNQDTPLRFLVGAWEISRRDEDVAGVDGYRVEKRVLKFSLSYLFLMFAALMADDALGRMGVF